MKINVTKYWRNPFFIHETVIVDDNVYIADGTKIWHFSHVQSNAIISLGYVGLPLAIAFTKIYHAIILAVTHDEFLNIDYKKLRQNKSVIFDIKSYLDRRLIDARL